MSTLSELRCVPCHGASEKLSDLEIEQMLEDVPGWQVIASNGSKRLQRTYMFDDFEDALAFTNEVGGIAEENNHHPAILTEWGKVTVTWWTHSVDGLHRNDFIMAAKCDETNADTAF